MDRAVGVGGRAGGGAGVDLPSSQPSPRRVVDDGGRLGGPRRPLPGAGLAGGAGGGFGPAVGLGGRPAGPRGRTASSRGRTLGTHRSAAGQRLDAPADSAARAPRPARPRRRTSPPPPPRRRNPRHDQPFLPGIPKRLREENSSHPRERSKISHAKARSGRAKRKRDFFREHLPRVPFWIAIIAGRVACLQFSHQLLCASRLCAFAFVLLTQDLCFARPPVVPASFFCACCC